MSLRTQLWIALALVLLLAAVVSAGVNALSARDYLQRQLTETNADSAAYMAEVLAGTNGDREALQAQLESFLERGDYRRVRLEGADGEVIAAHAEPLQTHGVPEWFVHLLGLQVAPGTARVELGDGAEPTHLTVSQQAGPAYQAYWQGTLQLGAVFLGVYVAIGLLGSLILSRLVAPLRAVVDQAQAIGERRFITIDEPRTREFRTVAEAMNRLSGRVRRMLREEAERLERLQQRLRYDRPTGLLNREYFIEALRNTLHDKSDAKDGRLLIVRMRHLAEIDRRIGRGALDEVIGLLARVLLRHAAAAQNQSRAGRLKGPDMALLLRGDRALDPETLLRELRHEVGEHAPGELELVVVDTPFTSGESASEVLSRSDAALAEAELSPGDATGTAAPDRGTEASQDAWRQSLRQALEHNDVQLGAFPVVDRQHQPIHTELPMRLNLNGQTRPASYYLAWAVRVGLIRELDEAVLRAALQRLDGHPGDAAINISVNSLCDARFRQHLEATLRTRPELAARLWVEVAAAPALRHWADLRELCLVGQRSGFRVGLEHAGSDTFHMENLGELGLDYIKISSALIRGIESSTEAQALLRGFTTLGHSLGLWMIAEGCDSQEQLQLLPDLGLDGMTGPAVEAPIRG